MLRYYITDMRALGGIDGLLANIVRVAEEIDLVQVREKHLASRELAGVVRRVVAAVPAGVRVLVNDRVDIAMACGAHGVHLRSNGVSAAAVRAIVPADFRIGVSCHGLEDLRRAESEGATFAVLAPIFETPGKTAPIGIEGLRAATGQVNIPVLALGGVTWERAPQCMTAGAAGIAGIRLFQSSASRP